MLLNLYGVYYLLFKSKVDDVGSIKYLRHLRRKTDAKGEGLINKIFKRSRYFSSVYKLIEAQNFKYSIVGDLVILGIVYLHVVVWMYTVEMSVVLRTVYTLLIGNIPVIVLSLRFRSIKSKRSYEGINLLSDLHTIYKIDKDMLTAIHNASMTCKDIEYLRKPLLKLTMRLRESATLEDMQLSIQLFRDEIGTRWAYSLGDIIYSALTSGEDQSYAIKSLIEDLEYGHKVFEKSKHLNSETHLIIKILIPACYIGLMFIGSNFFDVTVQELMSRQFTTLIGRQLFFAIISLQCVNLVIYYIDSNKVVDVV